jgi:Uma2 family endonuclease
MEKVVAAYEGLRMTAKEYLNLPDDGNQYELVNGVLVMVPAPTFEHQDCVTSLAARLRAFADQNQSGKVIVAPIDVILDDEEICQPDIIFIASGSATVVRHGRVMGAPSLAVEVTSPGTAARDYGPRKGLFARYGVREYWIVDPDRHAFEFYALEEGQFVAIRPRGAIYTSRVLRGFELDTEAFWEEIG